MIPALLAGGHYGRSLDRIPIKTVIAVLFSVSPSFNQLESVVELILGY